MIYSFVSLITTNLLVFVDRHNRAMTTITAMTALTVIAAIRVSIKQLSINIFIRLIKELSMQHMSYLFCITCD